jgi:hypothetical protein
MTIFTFTLPFWIVKLIGDYAAKTILQSMENIQREEARVDPEEWPHHWYYTYLLPDLEPLSKMGRFPWTEGFTIMK